MRNEIHERVREEEMSDQRPYCIYPIVFGSARPVNHLAFFKGDGLVSQTICWSMSETVLLQAIGLK
jgi:hypothetical protein